MFLLEDEVGSAMDAFAVKFSDILTRRRLLFGVDPFDHLTMSPAAIRRRTLQMLLNLMLRMRERYALVSLREEQLALVGADLTGPLRACAAALLALEGRPAASPRDAFAIIVSESGTPQGGEIRGLIDTVRRQGQLPPGAASTLIFSLMELAHFMYRRLEGTAGPGEENHA
jgi:hypothetical protein